MTSHPASPVSITPPPNGPSSSTHRHPPREPPRGEPHHTRIPAPPNLPRLPSQHVPHDPLRIFLRFHPRRAILASRSCRDLFLDAPVARGFWEFEILARGEGVGVYGASMYGYDFDGEGGHFEAEGVGDGGLSGFGAGVDAFPGYSAD